jgi:hypothetical protein
MHLIPAPSGSRATAPPDYGRDDRPLTGIPAERAKDGHGPPLVTVVVLCYNQSAYVAETLQSVADQTYRHIQLIIADDCSGDSSLAAIHDWLARSRMTAELVVNPENLGICRTLNKALALARGKYVSIVAADDTWLPEKLEREVEVLERATDDVAVVYTDSWRCDMQGRRLPQKFIEVYRPGEDPPEGRIFANLLRGNFIPAHTALIRKQSLDAVGPYDERLLYEDWDMWLRLAASFKFAFLDWPSGVYRVSDTSYSRIFRSQEHWGDCMATDFTILETCLTLPGVDEDLWHVIARRLCDHAELIYHAGLQQRRALTWRALRAAPMKRSALMWAMCCVGLPHSWFRRFDRIYRSRISKELSSTAPQSENAGATGH